MCGSDLIGRYPLNRAPSWVRRVVAFAAVGFAAACSGQRIAGSLPPSYAIGHPQETRLGAAFASQLEASPEKSGFHLLVSGQEAFLARAALAESAQRTLDLQYYIVGEDATSSLLLYRALSAAQRGVRVRLLVDDIYAVGRDLDFATLAAYPNVQVKVFNPFTLRGPLGISRFFEFLGNSDRLNRRMHNKLWIADNAVAVLGGRNLGDAYFSMPEESDFADLDVLAVGPVVKDISRSFDEYWNSDWAVPVGAFAGEPAASAEVDAASARMAANAERFRETAYARALREFDVGRLLRSGQLPVVAARGTAVYDKPSKPPEETGEHGRIVSVLRGAIEKARKEVILVSPYFIPSERGIGILCGLLRRGVRVRVLTNSLASTDVPVVHAGYARYRPRLLACGAEMHELRPEVRRSGSLRMGLSSGASLHAKAVVVDRERVLIGSMNLDPRSRRSNTETALLVESPALGSELGGLFDQAVSPEEAFRVELTKRGDEDSPLVWTGTNEGSAVRYTSEPMAGWWRRFVSRLLGALAPEEML